MKRLLVFSTFFALTLAGQASAQSTATASASATANVLAPITLTKTSDLVFGSMTRPTSGSSSIKIDEVSGGRSLVSGTATLATTSGVTPGRAGFSVGGDGSQTFTISTPPSVTMTRSGGTETLSPTLTATGATGTLSGGAATFGVGGTLSIDNSTVAGSYSGTFTETVAYN